MVSSGYYTLQLIMSYLGTYIGIYGVYIISTFLFIAMVRIGISFVFKIFRLNVNYNTMQENSRKNAIANDPRRDKTPRH